MVVIFLVILCCLVKGQDNTAAPLRFIRCCRASPARMNTTLFATLQALSFHFCILSSLQLGFEISIIGQGSSLALPIGKFLIPCSSISWLTIPCFSAISSASSFSSYQIEETLGLATVHTSAF
jgi:hypothetical protein